MSLPKITRDAERVVTLPELLTRVAPVRDVGGQVVFTNGCFDILHAGHASLMEQAARLGDCLVVGLNTDDSVRRLKGEQRPVVPESARALMLASLRSVDLVVLFDEDTPAQVIEALVPDILVKGGDYNLNDIVGRDVVEAAGGEVVRVDLVEGFSTTDLLRRLSP